MDFFSILTICGGLAFFLYGMHVMSTGLEKLAGGKLEKMLKRLTSNPFKSLLLGAGITIAIQSSSAMTVMLVGLVNSGIMQLNQTIGVIMGSNIGTTLTAWILSLAGIDSDNFFINLLKPSSFAPVVALIGIALIMISKKTRRKDIGTILVGFAVLMYGMTMMGDAVSGLKDNPQFATMMTAFNNPLLGVLVGAVVTGIIQSSAASVGILQSLAKTGVISYGMAIPIIMGQNIGTCVTSLISSIGVNKNAKRVVVVHAAFNLIGTVFFLIVFCIFNWLFGMFIPESLVDPALNPLNTPINEFGIAITHTVFNVVTTAMLLPFSKALEKLAKFVVRENTKNHPFAFLDERLLASPSVAVSECKSMTVKMAELARDTLLPAMDQIEQYSEKQAELIAENEEKLDMYEDSLGTYLVKLSGKELSDSDSRGVSKLLHSIGDFERLGDHALNILHTAQEMHEKELTFSSNAEKELAPIVSAIREIVDITITAFCTSDLALAAKVEPLEQVIDGLIAEEKSRHVERLQKGACTIELGFILSDLLNNYERVSDHCSNIAVCLIQTKRFSFETHEYLNELKSENHPEFIEKFEHYAKKYSLPD
ncbi:MAG: Na/Pi cotransporter family protein [Acutalibacteraceae bacterium]